MTDGLYLVIIRCIVTRNKEALIHGQVGGHYSDSYHILLYESLKGALICNSRLFGLKGFKEHVSGLWYMRSRYCIDCTMNVSFSVLSNSTYHILLHLVE